MLCKAIINASLLAVSLFAIVADSFEEEEQRKSYEGFKLLQVQDVQLKDVIHFQKLADKHYEEIDIWSYPSKSVPNLDIAVSPRLLKFLKRVLNRKRKSYAVLVENVQRLIDLETRQQEQDRRTRRSVRVDEFELNKYHSYDEIVDWLHSLQQHYRHLATVLNFTETFEGRPLKGILISSNEVANKPSIWIDAGIHAREWIAPATALYVINGLLTQYATNDAVKRAVDAYNWYILPVANPDGYEYTLNADRLWRKTRSRPNRTSASTGSSTTNSAAFGSTCRGVDANRNWGFQWGGAGSVTTAGASCSSIYAGPHPFSEPETLAMKSYLQAKLPNLKVYISFHSFGQFWLAPWGYTRDHKPDNFSEQKSMADKAIEAMKAFDGTEYTFGTIAELMYPASGTSIDYVAHLGVPYVFGLELRPEDTSQFGFVYPPKYILPTGREIFEGMKSIAAYLDEKQRLADAATSETTETTMVDLVEVEPSLAETEN